MSKKLIAVASAAALALTGLVGVAPAIALSPSVVASSGAGTSTDPYVSNAAESNEILADGVAGNKGLATTTAVRYSINVAAETTTVVTSTGGVKLSAVQTTTTNGLTAAGGVQSLSLASGTGTEVVFYAWNTSTTAGTVVIDYAGDRKTDHLRGAVGGPYSVSVTAPSVVGIGGQATLSAVVKDVFGNEVTELNATTAGFAKATDLATTFIGGASLAGGGWTYSTVRKAWEAKINGPSAAGQQAMTLELKKGNAAIASLAANGFSAPAATFFTSFNSPDLAVANAALTAQVAALQAQLAESRLKVNSVTKKRWNKLVRAHRALGGTAKLKR